MRISLVVVLVFLLQGCVTLIDEGRDFPMSKVDTLIVGETTPDQVVARFGEPISISEKTLENQVIYSYKDSLERGVTLGLPPIFLYSWKSGTGTTLNIVFIDGIYRGHEVITRQ